MIEKLTDCYLCGGFGGWEDHRLQQSVLCPLCHPCRPEPITWPDWLSGYDRMEAAYCGPLMPAAPTLVVIHRPWKSRACAEYFVWPRDNRKVSAHFAGSAKTEGYIQCVSLRRQAYHAGGATWNGDDRLNDNSIGIEGLVPMSQPWTRYATEQTRTLLLRLYHDLPSIVAIIGHHDGDPDDRSDPGSNWPWFEIVRGLGWRCPHITPT